MEIDQKKMLLETLEKLGSCEVIVSGESMKPFIRPGDRVHIIRQTGFFLPGHVIAFFNNDQLIVHRIYSGKKLFKGQWLYKVCGDSSPCSGGEIPFESVEGKVRSIVRNGKSLSLWFHYPFCVLALLCGLFFRKYVVLTRIFRKTPQ